MFLRFKQGLTDVAILARNFWQVVLPLARSRSAQRFPLPEEPKRFLILPCDPSAPTGSLGDAAMITALMQSLVQAHGKAHFTLVGMRQQELPISSIGPVEVVPAWVGRQGTLAFDRLVRQHHAVFALGADVLDGKYGAALVCRLLAYCNHAAFLGLPTTILGFSFNRSARWPAVRALAHAHPAVRVNVRDPRSLARLSSRIKGPMQLCADVAFLLKPLHTPQGKPETWIADMRRAGLSPVGINISAHAFAKVIETDGEQALVAAVAQQLATAGKANGLAYVLIPHDFKGGSGDVPLLKALQAALEKAGFTSCFYTETEDPARLKAMVGALDLVLTSRMHLAIACLGMGTPALSVAYQDKFEGLYEHFGLPAEDVLQPEPSLVSNLGAHLTRAFGRRAEVARQLSTILPQVLQLARRNVEFAAALAPSASKVGE